MKNNKGFAPVLIILAVFAVLAIGGGAYYIETKNAPVKENIVDNNTTTPSNNLPGGDKDEHGCIGSAGYSWCEVKNKCLRTWEEKCEVSATSEDGIFRTYIKKIYNLNEKTFIDADYFVTLRGKEAASSALNTGECVLKDNITKKQAMDIINSLSDDNTKFADKFYNYSLFNDCFNNGIWLDVNENPKIRVLEVDLKNPISMANGRDEYGIQPQQKDAIPVWKISLEALKNTLSKVNYDIPFEIIIKNNKIIDIKEIYRP